MKASDFNKLSFLEQVRAYVRECEISLQVETLDPAILSDIGTEGIVFDGYVVYLAKGDYSSDNGKTAFPGFHVWTEVSIPPTRDTPPDSKVVELLTTRRLEEAVSKVLDVVIHERMSGLTNRLADSEVPEE